MRPSRCQSTPDPTPDRSLSITAGAVPTVVCCQLTLSTGTGSGRVVRQSPQARIWLTAAGGRPGRLSRKSRTSSSVAFYPKQGFPSEAVFGPSPDPLLRLITCGGTFDFWKRSYRSNVVVTARLAT